MVAKKQRHPQGTLRDIIAHCLHEISLQSDDTSQLECLKETLQRGVKQQCSSEVRLKTRMIHNVLVFHCVWIITKLSRNRQTQHFYKLNLVCECLCLLDIRFLSKDEVRDSLSVFYELQLILDQDMFGEYSCLRKQTLQCIGERQEILMGIMGSHNINMLQKAPCAGKRRNNYQHMLQTRYTTLGSCTNVFNIQTLCETLGVSRECNRNLVVGELLPKALKSQNVSEAILATRCLGEMIKLSMSWDETEILLKALLRILHETALGVKIHAMSGLAYACSTRNLTRVLSLEDFDMVRLLVQHLFVIAVDGGKCHPHSIFEQASRDSVKVLLLVLSLSFGEFPDVTLPVKRSEALSIVSALTEHRDPDIVKQCLDSWCLWLSKYEEEVLKADDALSSVAVVLSSSYTPASTRTHLLRTFNNLLSRNEEAIAPLLVEFPAIRDSFARCASQPLPEEDMLLSCQILMKLSNDPFHLRMMATQTGVITSLIRQTRKFGQDESNREQYRKRIMELAEVL